MFWPSMWSGANQDILRSNIPIKLQLNKITDIEKWQNAKMYQYLCIDRDFISNGCYQFVWIPISGVATISGETASFEAVTKDSRLGLFAIFGNK